MESEIVLSMKKINISFPGVKALNNVDFTLRRGEIHALMGENGAGKSTLIKVLTGVYTMDSGLVFLEGSSTPTINHSPEEAQRNGISTVYQEINLCPNLSVAENIFVGHQPLNKFKGISWKKMNEQAHEAMCLVGLDRIDVTRPLGEFSTAIQQMVAIARAMTFECKILILDEPTSSLDEQEVTKLFEVMNHLKSLGVSIIFVTHFLDQVYEVTDQITILRNGELVGQFATKELPRYKLVEQMLGREMDVLASLHKRESNKKNDSEQPIILKAVGLGKTGSIKPFNIEIRKGEIVGLTGLLGSGRSELARTLFCADQPDQGVLEFSNKEIKAKEPVDMIKEGMAYLPEDRKVESIVADLSVRENLILALQAKTGVFKLLPMAKQMELTDKYIKALNIKTSSSETLIKQLSGGNQQKVIIGRWLATNPEFLILDESTRGIDVGTKAEIQKLILQLADQGLTIMFISSEIDEMLRTVDRLCVLRDRVKVGELENTDLDRQKVMASIAGGEH